MFDVGFLLKGAVHKWHCKLLKSYIKVKTIDKRDLIKSYSKQVSF